MSENDSTPAARDHAFIRWFVGNPVVANLFLIVILAWGLYNAFNLRKESFPAFSPESVQVFVPFNGGVPEDVERGVAIKIEEALQGVDGIDHIRSTSTDNSATVIVEAVEDYPLTKLLDDVKIQVDSISTFPEQAENPIITENEQRHAVIWLEVSGDVPETLLKETARTIRDELLALPEIDTVDTEGARDYEISVEVSEEKLRAYNLTFDEVAAAVSTNSIDLSGGLLRSPRGDISLRARSQAYHAADFRNLPLRVTNEGARIFLGDVAEIRDGFVDQKFLHRFDGKPSVSLQITTDGGNDIIDASTRAAELAKNYEERFGLPEGVTLSTWKDGSEPIRSRLRLLSKNGIQGVILVLISLSLFLNLRLAIWVALGIPVSMAGALILFPIPGIDLSINMITAFSFIVVLGLIVDDAIVIGESVFSEKENPRNRHLSEDDQTVKGVARVVTPATFGVLTTIAAFFPLTQVSGMLGNVFGQIAKGVIFCLIFSLIESKFILPSHLAHIRVDHEPRNFLAKGWKRFQGGIAKFLLWSVERVYRPALGLAMKFRYVTLALFISTLILVVSLLPAGILRFVFFPDIFTDDVTVTLELEEGLPVDVLHEGLFVISNALQTVDEGIEKETGEGAVRHIRIGASTNTLGTVSANLTTSESREISTGEIVRRWRREVGPIAGSKALSFFGTAGPPGQGLAVQLESKNLEDLQAAATALKKEVSRYPGVNDVTDSFKSGRPEIELTITETGQASGFSRLDLANAIRAAFFGIESQRIQRGRDEVKVMVRYPEADRGELNTLREMRVRSSNGTAVPFSLVAETEFGKSLAAIERADYNRIASVTADIDKSITTGDEILAELEKNYFPTFRGNFPGVNIALRGDAEEQIRSMNSLKKGLALSVILIFILLAIPLKSFTKPLFIMSVIPYGIIGALLGHSIVGIPVSILSLFGIIALSGIVVNDSLVLTSRIDDLRATGISLREAVLEAGPQRFRAILLTTVTTFLGLIPLLLETSTQAQFLKPMAVSVAFGVIFATAITLVLLPILFVIADETFGASFRYYGRLINGNSK